MTKSIRVLSVCTSDSTGGAARAAYRIHLAVKPFGIDSRMFVKNKDTMDPDVISVAAFQPKGLLYKLFDWGRNKVKNQWQHFIWSKYPGRTSHFLSDLRSADIHGAFRKLDYDLLHLHWINLRFLPLDKLPKDTPIVWTLHDSWPFCGVCHLPMECRGFEAACGACPALRSDSPHDLSHQVWKKKAGIYSHLDLHVVAPSRWMAECAERSSLLGGLDIKIIPNCIDITTFSPGDRTEACLRAGLDPGKTYLLFGAMNALKDENKGWRHLSAALTGISTLLPKETELVVFGSKEPFEDQIAGIRVIDKGVLKDSLSVKSLYRASSVTIVPSFIENLSCTIMEAMSCGSPVVAFDVGGNKDLIDHHINGYLAKEQDSDDLARGILWCIENNHEGRLAQNARQKVLDNFSFEIIGEKYAALYKSLMK